MGLYFSNEYYKKKALETNQEDGKKSRHSVGEAFLLLVKDVPKEDLTNLILMVKEYFETLTKPVNLSLENCYDLMQGKSVNGIEMDESIKRLIVELAYQCIESDKNLGEKTIQDGKINTSNWMGHVLYVSKFAGELAGKLNVDVKTAQIQGMLHDYGRKISHGPEHIIIGYEKLIDEGWEEEAIACLSHSFLNGGRCTCNAQAEEGFYVDENGYPAWKEGTKKDDITIFLENYKYSKYDTILNIADLVATSNGIVSPYERIEDIATRRKLDPINRGYFLAEFTNQLVEILRETGGNISSDLAEEIKATSNISIDEIKERLKKVSDLFFEHYKKEICLKQNFAKVSVQEIARLVMKDEITMTELDKISSIIHSINTRKREDDGRID